MQCPNCSHENPVDARFCSQCATSLEDRSAVIEQVATRSTSRAKAFLVLGLLVAVVPMGMFCMMSGVFGDGTVEGQIESVGKPHGDWSMQPTSCFSGQHESFFGVWVTPDLQKVPEGQGFKGGLKLVKAHTGQWEVYVESPVECQSFNCVIRPLAADQCSVFEVSVSNTNTTINDIRVREGHAKLACKLAEGGSLTADLKFDGCS